jgi:hypothetical protein
MDGLDYAGMERVRFPKDCLAFASERVFAREMNGRGTSPELRASLSGRLHAPSART